MDDGRWNRAAAETFKAALAGAVGGGTVIAFVAFMILDAAGTCPADPRVTDEGCLASWEGILIGVRSTGLAAAVVFAAVAHRLRLGVPFALSGAAAFALVSLAMWLDSWWYVLAAAAAFAASATLGRRTNLKP